MPFQCSLLAGDAVGKFEVAAPGGWPPVLVVKALLHQQIGRNAQGLAQRTHLRHGQPPATREELRHARASAHQGRKIPARHAALFEHERHDLVRSTGVLVKRIGAILVVLHEHREELQPFAILGIAFRVEQRIDIGNRRLILA